MRPIALSLLAVAGCSGGVDPTDYSSFPLAYGVQIDKVAWLQGVETVLHLGPGEFASGSRPPPLILGRDALLRVHLSADEAFQGKEVAVVFSYGFPPFEAKLSQLVSVEEPWDEFDLGSTATFTLPENAVVDDLSIGVSVHDPYLGYRPPIEADPPVWSSEDDGGLELSPTDAVTLRIFPVQYAADGSQRVPDTSEAALDDIRDTFFAMYPVSRVNLEVADPLVWTTPISANGGWESLLNHLTELRTDADVPENTYFYGLFDPAADFGTFCQSGCTLGLSNLAFSPGDSWARASIGLGYTDHAASTLVHEVGHAHGRLHADCGGAAGVDPGFPYGNARLGSWGYNLRTTEMIDPLLNADMMSYCEPHWVSDYTFTALLDRITAISDIIDQSAGPLGRVVPKLDWQLVQFDATGEGTVGTPVKHKADPGGEPVDVELIGAGGQVLEVVEGYLVHFDHAPGGLALVPPTTQRAAVTRTRLLLP